tara:strand:+ start:1522 stop:3540 length:2019 start_codon:yes stop_codon:yes gene_type:complete
MIEESTLKSNFIGRDGFRWWIGQIAQTASAPEQANGEGWAFRYKVRILGYHTNNLTELSDENLPWAGVMMPTTAGSGGGGFAQSARINQGDIVVGFFLDGDDAQIPVIMGAFGKTQFTPSLEPSNPFVPFTGYTTNIKRPDTKSDRESTGQSSEDQTQPRNLEGKSIDTLNENNKGKGKARQTKASDATGKVITFADTCEDNFATEVTGILGNLINVISEGTDFLGDIQNAVKKIQVLANQFVGTLFNSLYTALIPILKNGLDLLYKQVYAAVLASTGNPVAAHLAGVAAQESMVGPLKAVQDAIACVSAKIINGLGDTLKDLIESTVLEVVNFGVCTAEQFVGSFLNGIIDNISSGLDSVLGGISRILELASPGFKIVDFLRSSVDVIKSIQNFFSCNQTADKCDGVKEWTIGYGPKNKAKVNDILDNALEFANISNALSGITKQTSPYSKPDCGTPTSCGGPTVSFFGGNGIGGAGKVIMGGIVNNTDGLGEITSSVARTGSIIGVEITDPGSKYSYAPPMVTFEDSCGLGYGAVGRAIVDYDKNSSTYGQITGVYIVSEGENYPVEDPSDISEIEIENGSIVDTIVLYPGIGYNPGDTATDDNGEEYDLTIEDGKIISASPINRLKVTKLPTITISTETGIGALIKPIIGTFIPPQPPQNEIISVIDCV